MSTTIPTITPIKYIVDNINKFSFKFLLVLNNSNIPNPLPVNKPDNKVPIVNILASLIGLIPNCASSVIITELYLSKLITIGTLFSGLLTGSGLGILLLFKTNKNIKENITILSIIYFVGVLIGFLIDLIL